MAIVTRKRKDGSMSYQVKFQDSEGNWYPSATFDSRDQAMTEEARLRKLKRNGKRALSTEAKRLLMDEYWDVWSVENRAGVSKGWKISQDQMYRDHVSPVIGKLTIAAIGTPEIGHVMNKAKDKGLGPQTRKHLYSLLNKMFGDALEYYEMISSSPVKPKFHRPLVPKAKRDFLSPDQSRLLLNFTRDTYVGPAVWLEILAGLRISEVQALLWSEVMWERNQILIRRAYNNKTKVIQEYPKQQDWPYVPMIPALKDYLFERKGKDSEFVVKGPKGGMLSYNTYRGSLPRFCRLAGVTELTTHELRHSATELWVEAGASAEDIRRLLNHSSLSATALYMHRTDPRLTEIGKTVGGEALRIIPGVKNNLPKYLPKREEKGVRASREDADVLLM